VLYSLAGIDNLLALQSSPILDAEKGRLVPYVITQIWVDMANQARNVMQSEVIEQFLIVIEPFTSTVQVFNIHTI